MGSSGTLTSQPGIAADSPVAATTVLRISPRYLRSKPREVSELWVTLRRSPASASNVPVSGGTTSSAVFRVTSTSASQEPKDRRWPACWGVTNVPRPGIRNTRRSVTSSK